MRIQALRPVFAPGGSVVAAASGTASFVARGASHGFYVYSSAAAFVSVRNNNTADSLDATDAAPIAASVLYGPFEFAADDKYIAVAGNGGAATVTVTLI